MDKADDIFTQFLGTQASSTDGNENDWVDSLYESINTNGRTSVPPPPSEQQQQQQELYDEVSKLKSRKLNVPTHNDDDDNDDQSAGSFTIPVDSPSMHIFVHSDDELDQKTESLPIIGSITSSSTTSVNIKPPTFAQVQNIPIHPKPIAQSETKLSLSKSPLTEQLHFYQVVKEGLKEYCGSLYDAEPDKSLDNRAEYMSKYLLAHNINYTSRNVSECFSQIRKDETDLNLTTQLGDGAIISEIRELLVESVKRRKSYTRRKGAKPSSKGSSSSTSGSTHGNNKSTNLSSIGSSNITNIPKQHIGSSNSTGGIVNTIKIGAFLNQRNLTVDELNIQNLTTIADHSKVIQNREDERYIYQLRAQSIALKNCIDDIYGNSLPMISYPLTYSKVPLKISPSMSIDLENDRMISYVDVLLDLSDMILPFDRNGNNGNQQGNYTKIIQLKSITRIYDHGTLIYRKCDPVTGFFPSDVSNISKIILPLQAKFWAGFINDHHNGIVNQSVFENLKITHTLLPNDDIIKFKTGSAPIYSFIWEFDIAKSDQQMVPYSVIVSKLDNKRHQQQQQHMGYQQQQQKMPLQIPLPQQQKTSQLQFQRQIAPKRVASMNNAGIMMGSATPMTSSFPPHSSDGGSSGIYKQSNHSIGMLPIQRHGLGIRNVSNVGHKRTRSRSVNEIDFLADINTIANSTFNGNADPFTPVSPTMIMNHGSNSSVLDPGFLQTGFESFNSTPQSSLASASITQSSFDLSSHGVFSQVGQFRNED